MIRFVNNVKTALLLGGLMALCLLVGAQFGRQGLIFGFMFGGLMNVVAYFFSDKIALASMRAQIVTEDEAPELHHIVAELAERAGLPMPRVAIAPMAAPNAFATGRNPNNAVVCVTEGILRILNRNELRGVIGHELSHVKHRDILISSVAATIAGAISALGYLLWFVPLGGRSDSRGGNPLAALAMIILAPIAAALIQMAISRSREYAADSLGAELAGDPMYLATALERLHVNARRIPLPVDPSKNNMFIVAPLNARGAANLFSTHPPVEKRVQALIGRPTTGLV